MPRASLNGSFWHSSLNFPSSLIYSSSNKARSTPRQPLPRQPQQPKKREMDRSTFPQSSDDMPEHQAHDEQPPGVEQASPTDPWQQFFSNDLPHLGSLPQPGAGFIRRPAGWTPVQAGHGVYTPQGNSTPLSAAISRVVAADAAIHGRVDAPPPDSGPPVHMNLVGARGGYIY